MAQILPLSFYHDYCHMPFQFLSQKRQSLSPALEFGLIHVTNFGPQNEVEAIIVHHELGYKKPVCFHLLSHSSAFPVRRCLSCPSGEQGRCKAGPSSPSLSAKAILDQLTLSCSSGKCRCPAERELSIQAQSKLMVLILDGTTFFQWFVTQDSCGIR